MVIIKRIFKIFEWIFFALLLCLLLLVVSPLLPTKDYISTYVVLSGSMEPTIKTGSIIFITNGKQFNKDDIIAFTSPLDIETTIIHRIERVEEIEGTTQFSTKGDNNKEEDNWKIEKSEIKGKMICTIPYLGYAIDWLKTPLGFGILLGLPAVLLIISQIQRIREGINEEVQQKLEKELMKRKKSNGTVLATFIFLFASSFCFFYTNYGYAFFSSQVTLQGISLSTKEVSESVIINEIMWTGTDISIDDQWIELKNLTNNDTNIGKWKIQNVRDLNKPPLMIPANSIIAANGYFLISSYPSQSKNTALAVNSDWSNASIELLNENNGNLVLKDKDGNIVDEILGYPTWPAGLLGDTLHSMQRINSGSGLMESNWDSCTLQECNNKEFWKEDSITTYGTPKAENIF